MTTSTGAGIAPARTGARRNRLAYVAGMLWAERALVLGLGAAICTLGLVAALAAPSVPDMSGRWPIMIVTLLVAAVLSIGAGLSRGLLRRSFPAAQSKPLAPARGPRSPTKGTPKLVLVQGGLRPAST